MRKDSLIHNPLGIPSIQIGRDPLLVAPLYLLSRPLFVVQIAQRSS
jgi:hypothetical protein